MHLAISLILAQLALCSPIASAQQPTIIEIAPGIDASEFDNLRIYALSNDSTPWFELGTALQRVTTDGTAAGTVLASQPTGTLVFAEALETANGGLLALGPSGLGPLVAQLRYQPIDGGPVVDLPGLGRSDFSTAVAAGRKLLARVGDEVWALVAIGAGPVTVVRIDGQGQMIAAIPLPNLPGLTELGSASIHSFGNRALLFTTGSATPTLWSIDSNGGVGTLVQFSGGGAQSSLVDADFLGAKLIGLRLAGADSGIYFVDANLGVAPVGERTTPETAHSLAVGADTAYAVSFQNAITNPKTRILKFDAQGGLTSLTLNLAAPIDDRNLAMLGSRLVFAGTPSATQALKPWITDGTIGGSQQLSATSLVIGDTTAASFAIRSLGAAVYFVGVTPDGQRELFRSDGSPAGSVALEPFPTAVGGAARAGFAVGNGRLILAPTLGVGGLPTLYSLDPLGGQSELLVAPNYTEIKGQVSALVDQFTPMAEGMFFTAQKLPNDRQVGITDGAQAGTQLLTSLDKQPLPGPLQVEPAPRLLTVLGRNLIFTYQQGVYALDAGTRKLALLLDVAAADAVRQGDSLLFTGYRIETVPGSMPPQQSVKGAVYRTRGTPETTGTVLPLDFALLPAGPLAALEDRFLIALSTPGNGQELWVSDGTPAGTTMLVDAKPGQGSSFPYELTRIGDRVYFTTARSGYNHSKLWVTDGTSAGTQVVFEAPTIVKDTPLRLISNLAVLGERLLFAVRDTNGEFEPWISDGTSAGTIRLADLPDAIPPQVVFSFTEDCAQIVKGGRAWFVSRTSNPGVLEMWITDGTPAGTQLLRILAGLPGGQNTRFVDVGLVDQVLFLNQDAGGLEPWISDGTVAGTRPLYDLYPGPNGSFGPQSALVAGHQAGKLFFSARFPNTGFELGVLPLSIAGGWAKARLGESCGGALGRPEIDATGSATLGQSVSIDVSGLAPLGLVILQFGAEPSLPLGAGQCALQLVGPQLLGFAVTGSNGQASFPLSVPQNPNLIDRAAYFQALALDPSAGFLGLFSLSQVLEVAIGG